eukprot:1146079-Pelagomonas_calceolata.AAC.4
MGYHGCCVRATHVPRKVADDVCPDGYDHVGFMGAGRTRSKMSLNELQMWASNLRGSATKSGHGGEGKPEDARE